MCISTHMNGPWLRVSLLVSKMGIIGQRNVKYENGSK